MDIYTTAFIYPRRIRSAQPAPALPDPHGFGPANGGALQEPEMLYSKADVDAVQAMVNSATSTSGSHITCQPNQSRWDFMVTGAYQQVMMARGTIMRDCPTKSQVAIKVPRSELLERTPGNPTIKAEVRRRLDDIASLTSAHIAVVNSHLALSARTPPDGISNSAGWSGLETERVCELQITGQPDAIEVARVRLLVMLDELSGLHSDSCEIDRKLHSLVAGRKRQILQTIQEETATNIYFPSALQGLLSPAQALASVSPNTIWITGEFFSVQRARDMLYQVSITKNKALISRDTAILPRKLDWMVIDRADELRSIMHDNATFIQLPPLGSSTSLITVFGDHRVNIQRTIRSIMQLACSYYVASLWLLPIQFNPLLPPPSLNASQVALIIQQISGTTGAEVVFKSMCFEMHGVEQEVRAAVAMVLELDIIKNFHHEIRFQIELANEHKEFISGKKNGKMNKIMQTTNVKIKFETFNDHNFLIDIAGNDVTSLAGLALLQEELPAEISFHVPESYHKRIIGVGGRSIQRIMKKYGVYVKFSNAEEFAALGGYNDNEDNVVARTPAKNAMNLDNLKQSVLELVNPKDKDYMNELVSIPRRYHRTLLGEKAIFIHDIESKTNSKVYFPDKELASDVVTIFGPESQVQIASAMLLDHVPFEADMAVPVHPDLQHVCSSPDFVAFTERIKREYQIVISPNMKGAVNGAVSQPASSADFRGDTSFKFRCQRSNTDSLMTARELLEQFLLDHNVHVYPSPTAHTHKRGDSFTSAFPHFDSKLLSMKTRESADLGRPSQSLVDRRLRMASSSPDVKALFNGAPSYIYPKLEHSLEQAEEDGSEFNYSEDPVYAGDSAEDHWTPGPLPPIGSGYHHRSRHSEDTMKRGSDSLLDAKMRDQLTHSRSMSDRARSLDLTASLSRITESSSAFLDESPTEELPETDTPATLSFPSVYGPPASGSGRSSVHSARPSDDGVSGAFQNLGL